MAYTSGKLTKNLVRTLGPGRHCDGHVPYLVVDPSCAQRWIVRAKVKGQRNRQGNPLRTDFGLGGVDVVTLNVARGRALFRRVARQVHIERLQTMLFPRSFECRFRISTSLKSSIYRSVFCLCVDPNAHPVNTSLAAGLPIQRQ